MIDMSLYVLRRYRDDGWYEELPVQADSKEEAFTKAAEKGEEWAKPNIVTCEERDDLS
jgi:hypothetical protein